MTLRRQSYDFPVKWMWGERRVMDDSQGLRPERAEERDSLYCDGRVCGRGQVGMENQFSFRHVRFEVTFIY